MTPDMSSMDWRGSIATLEAERDALREELRIIKARMDRCDLADHKAEMKLRAERDALRAEVKSKEAECWAGAEEVVRLRDALRDIEREAAQSIERETKYPFVSLRSIQAHAAKTLVGQ
jgi:chromosome segregation ATPase